MLYSRREWLALSAAAALRAAGSGQPGFSFWVFGLLHPRELRIRACSGTRVHCQSQDEKFVLEPGCARAILSATNVFRATGPQDAPVSFLLEIPGVLQRRFFGTLDVHSDHSILVPSITMPAEIAVSSIVGAELPLWRAPMAALMAQSVVARSFLFGTGAPRHQQAFFCDTTHCQFLRAPALAGTAAAQATSGTARLVLASNSAVFPASYSAACGGRTGGGERDGFCYRSVECCICRERKSARRGHGWGLCQEGAIGLARLGWDWHRILAHYFPDASLRYL